jgi:hypothetical protein
MVNHPSRFYLIPLNAANTFDNWLNDVDHRFEILIGVGGLDVM